MKYGMGEWETLKVYGKCLNDWKETRTDWQGNDYEATIQVELAYTEYDNLGNVVRKGSEDFSFQRYDTCTSIYDIWVWDGERFNKGGYRWFERAKRVRINAGDLKKLRHVALKWFPEAKAIDFRKW